MDIAQYYYMYALEGKYVDRPVYLDLFVGKVSLLMYVSYGVSLSQYRMTTTSLSRAALEIIAKCNLS